MIGLVSFMQSIFPSGYVLKTCCHVDFCDRDETIKHLFLDCLLAKVLWQTIHIAFNITPPNSVNTLFGTWLNGIEPDLARHIRVGVCALMWAIWNCRNDLVFNMTTCIHFLQVIFRATALIRSWLLLTLTEAREHLVTGSIRWKMVFNQFGWRLSVSKPADLG